MTKILHKFTPIIAITLIITSCGGGGGGGGGGGDSYTPPATPAATSTISLSSEKGYVGESVTVTWSSANATSCTASNAWTGTKGTSGSESFSLDAEGSFAFEISCSGSGGSGSASVSFQVFKYDKQTDDVTNKNWDAEGFATITEGLTSGNGFLTNIDYSGDGSNLLTVTAFEPSSSSFELDYSGSTADGNSFDFGLVFNDWNTSTTLLYDPDDTENAAYAFIKATYADATVDGFLTLPDYFSTKGIDYVSAALVEIFTNPYYYVIPTNVGEFTKTDDLPSSGTSSKTFDTLGYYYEASVEAGNQYAGYIVADGQGTLDFDFTNNTVSGSLTYDTFVPYTSFKNGTGVYNLITSIPDQTINLQNGTISGNSFSAEIVLANDATSAQTIEVGVEANSNGSGNVYVIDGVQRKSLTLNAGTTYTFNHSSSHPLRFSTTSDGTHSGGSEYTAGVTTSSGTTVIEVTSSTPTTLYYYCDVHSGMGSDITVNTDGVSSGAGIIQGHFYGRNADEIGVNIILLDNDDNQNDYFIFTAGGIGQTQ
jgi:plastocyanin